MKLEMKKFSCGYGSKPVVSKINLSVKTGEVLCLLGPNGAGKTSLFKTMIGLLKPLSGSISFDGRDLDGMRAAEKARLIAWVPQSHDAAFPFSVIDVVLMGRTCFVGNFSSPKTSDYNIAVDALETLGIEHLRDEEYTRISGGEQQLVLIARALAQRADFLIMDEPTSNLDYGNQMRVLLRIKQLAAGGRGIIMSSHHPNHALLCADRAAVIDKGSILDEGTPDKVITGTMLKKVFGVESKITNNCCVPVFA